jgi:hypothetical protein
MNILHKKKEFRRVYDYLKNRAHIREFFTFYILFHEFEKLCIDKTLSLIQII